MLGGILLFASCLSTKNISKSHNLLQAQVDSLQQMGAHWDTLNWREDDQVDSMLGVFPGMLEKVLLNPEVATYRLDTLAFFNEQSDDGRFAFFSWEEKMGGTYRPGINLRRYQKPNDSIVVEYFESEIFVGGVSTLQAKNGETLYVVEGSGKGCTTCFFSEIYLFQITNKGLKTLFNEDGQFRYTEDTQFDYHAEKQELDILYYDIECTDETQDFSDSCKVEAHYYFDGETFVIKE